MKRWWLYIMDRRGRYYTGITTDLSNRLHQHGVTGPFYQEGPMTRSEAVEREKEVKGWRREKKERLITGASSKK